MCYRNKISNKNDLYSNKFKQSENEYNMYLKPESIHNFA